MFPVCEVCAENDIIRAGVYRDDDGRALCEEHDDARLRANDRVAGDYGRPVETGPRLYKRPKERF